MQSHTRALRRSVIDDCLCFDDLLIAAHETLTSDCIWRYLGKMRLCWHTICRQINRQHIYPQGLQRAKTWQRSAWMLPHTATTSNAGAHSCPTLSFARTSIFTSTDCRTHCLQENCRRSRRHTPVKLNTCTVSKSGLRCCHKKCPDYKAQYSQSLAAAKMAALRPSVTGSLEVLHMSGVASLSAHAVTYQSTAQECIRRLPSFAPSSICFDFALR